MSKGDAESTETHEHDWLQVNLKEYMVCTVCHCLRLKTEAEKAISGPWENKSGYPPEPFDTTLLDPKTCQASIAISLRRIADRLETRKPKFSFFASNGAYVCSFETNEQARLVQKQMEILFGNLSLREDL